MILIALPEWERFAIWVPKLAQQPLFFRCKLHMCAIFVVVVVVVVVAILFSLLTIAIR
jgi:hypothetical protein